MTPLVSTEWLAAHLADLDLVVFDATYYLPAEQKDAGRLYMDGRIPGARFFDIDTVADFDTDLPHMVPAPGRFDRCLSALGASNASRIVFYDQKGLQSAARGWWMMGLFGHDQAAVLDGGLPKWRAEGRPLETSIPDEPPSARFRSTYRPTRLRGLGDMMALPSGTIVLDARAAGRFSGSMPEPRPGIPSGHMPGARNIPSTSLLASDGTMLPPDRLRAIFAGHGADGTRPVVTTCGSGVTAAILTLAMVHAGLPVGAVYDGSWTEWASRPDTIKETTPEETT